MMFCVLKHLPKLPAMTLEAIRKNLPCTLPSFHPLIQRRDQGRLSIPFILSTLPLSASRLFLSFSTLPSLKFRNQLLSHRRRYIAKALPTSTTTEPCSDCKGDYHNELVNATMLMTTVYLEPLISR